jgi:RNAse (barnase) inhibitor barstar
MKKKTYIIDGNKFSNLEGFYDEVQKTLTDKFDGFGRNLDAFNDILLGGFGRFEYGEPIELIWKNSTMSSENLGFLETVKYIKEKLEKVHPTNISRVKKDLELAEKREGSTLFEILVEIIQRNQNVSLVLA